VNHDTVAMRPADNPFASRRIDGLHYRFRRGDINDIKAALARHGNRGAIVGPHGRGKTTLLDALAGHLEGEIIRVSLRSDTRRPLSQALASLPAAVRDIHAVLLDGAEQLGRWSWRRVHHRIRKAGAIIITSHRPGRLPTIHRCTTDPALLAELVAELAPEMVGAVDLEDLFRRHGGNIRLCFRDLYDLWAGRGVQRVGDRR
jgi:ABC-type branched-subunit amino acid transport system ATPase component